MASKTRASKSRTSARVMSSVRRSSAGTGPKSSETATYARSRTQQKSLFPTFGLEDSHVKTCLWQEWGRELGLKGNSLDSFMNFIDYLQRVAPEFLLSKTCQAFCLPMEDETSNALFERWPNSGMVWGGVCLTAKTSESPNHAKESSLWDLMEKGEVPAKYFLSQNAARGILRRADRMGRSLFPPLREALEILAKAP